MKLRSIALGNVRRFTDTVRIDGIGDGLNVLCEPNEYGKSTIFEAVQALFFKPHGSRDKEVMALRPHAGGAPEVEIGIETDMGRFHIAKRWLSKPAATVTRDGRLIAQADEAEAWIAAQLGGGDGGPSGLLWVRQGMTGLADGSRKEQDASLEARRDLLSSVTGEVEAMTGGRRMDEALARCAEELGRYATKTGRPATGGPWKAAAERVETLDARQRDLADTARALHEALAARTRCRRALTEIEAPEAVAERKARLEAATEAHRAAERHAGEVETAAQKVKALNLSVSNLKARLDALRMATAERRAAEADKHTATVEAEAAVAAREAAAAALAEAEARRNAALGVYTAAEEARRQADRRAAARDGAARRKDLAQRIFGAEAARQAMEDAGAEARNGPDAKALRCVEELAGTLATARAVRDGAAAQIVMAHAPGREGFVTLAGAALPDGAPVPIPDGAELAIAGIGTLTIRPGAGGRDDGSVEAAQAALRKALDAQDCDSVDAARIAATARVEAERRKAEASATFKSLAPDGLDALRAALAAIPEVTEDGADGPDRAEAQTAFETAEAARIAAQAERDAAQERHANAGSRAASADAAMRAATDRLSRAETGLAPFGAVDEGALAAELQSLAATLAAAEALHDERTRTAPDLAAAEAALTRARSVEDKARAEVARLKPEIATLDERIARSSGDAVEERLAETEQELLAASADLARIEREVAVLAKLRDTLEAARAEARERYFEPVAAELKPLLHLLWPDADLSWGDRTLLPEALTRGGQAEPVEILSGGTQEQVALLVRLAFARMLARTGRHAPVILDDALVFSDDDRIERMFDALHRQAGDLQILVLTCRQRAFRSLGGHGLRLSREVGTENAA